MQSVDLERAFGSVFFKTFTGVLQPGEFLAECLGRGGGRGLGGRFGDGPDACFRGRAGDYFLEFGEALLTLVFGALA